MNSSELPPYRSFAIAIALILAPPALLANITSLSSTNTVVTIDGVLDEEAWQYATQIQIATETNPGENIPARVSTVAYLIEDGEKLYVAFDARDPNPGAIRAYLQDRDSAWNDDFVGIVLDTFLKRVRIFGHKALPYS